MKTFKQLIIAIAIIVTLLVSSFVVYIYYQEDNLKEIVIEELNKSIKSSINVSEIDFFVIKNFPYVSVELNDLYAIDAFNKDTLCEIEKMQLKFNALNLYNRNYNVEEIILRNGFASIYFKENLANYEIWHVKEDSGNKKNADFGLENIKLENIKIKYHNDKIKSSFINEETQVQLKFKNGRTEINLDGEITNEKFEINNIDHLSSKNIKLNGSIILDSLGFNIKSNFNVSDVHFDLNAEKIDDRIKVNLKTNNLDLEETKELIPNEYISSIKNYEFKGNSKFNLNYLYRRSNESSIKVDFDLNQGSLKSQDLHFAITGISLKGNYYNGNLNSEKISEINLDDIKLKLNGEPFEANATIKGEKNPTLNLDFETQLELSEIKKLGYKHNFKSLTGKTKIKGNYNGKIGLKNKLTYDITMAEKIVDVDIKNLSFKLDDKSPMLSKANIEIKIVNDNLNVLAFKGNLSEKSKISFVGGLENLFSYLFLNNSDLKIAGNLSSDLIIADELFDFKSSSESQKDNDIYVTNFPNKIIANINLSLLDFSLDRFHMRNFFSKISYKNKLLKVKDIELETMSGKINSNITFEQLKNNNVRLISTTNLNNINVRQLFYEFHNFGQSTMRHKHLIGKIDSEIYFRNEFDKYLNAIDDLLYCFIDVKINNGELLEFEPLMMMSDYISVEELKRIKFSTLENQIEIKNNIIYIPFMEINSTAIDIAGAGTHSFENEINYEFKILLNEILSNKFKRKNKKKVSEFGVVQEDGIKGMTMFLKMEGTVDDPKISYNTLRLRESLSDGFKKEKKELRDIINNQFKNKINDNFIHDNPNYENIIEWEE